MRRGCRMSRGWCAVNGCVGCSRLWLMLVLPASCSCLFLLLQLGEDPEGTGRKSILELMDTVDKTIPEPPRLIDADFMMPVEGQRGDMGRPEAHAVMERARMPACDVLMAC